MGQLEAVSRANHNSDWWPLEVVRWMAVSMERHRRRLVAALAWRSVGAVETSRRPSAFVAAGVDAPGGCDVSMIAFAFAGSAAVSTVTGG